MECLFKDFQTEKWEKLELRVTGDDVNEEEKDIDITNFIVD